MIGTRGLSPPQTVGPFFHFIIEPSQATLVGEQTRGERIRIEGSVRDGDGAPIPDAMVEIWQANASGRYAHSMDQRTDATLDPHFAGFGRSGTDDGGAYWFETIRPGPVAHPQGGWQAPHILVAVFARGMLQHVYTRLYFADDPATAADPVLALVPAARRHTLLATRAGSDGHPTYRFDICIQGPERTETVFFRF